MMMIKTEIENDRLAILEKYCFQRFSKINFTFHLTSCDLEIMFVKEYLFIKPVELLFEIEIIAGTQIKSLKTWIDKHKRTHWKLSFSGLGAIKQEVFLDWALINDTEKRLKIKTDWLNKEHIRRKAIIKKYSNKKSKKIEGIYVNRCVIESFQTKSKFIENHFSELGNIDWFYKY